MIWYFDQYGTTFYGTDLYGRLISINTNTPVYFFREERRYRYSGALYTKLRSLINMMSFNKYFTLTSLNVDGDNGYFVTIRFKSCDVIYCRTTKLFISSNPIVSGEFYNKLYYHTNAHFVDN